MEARVRSEEWKPVVGYEGLYAVSDMGRVKSVERMCKNRYSVRRVREKMLKSVKDKKGYLYVVLSKNGVRKAYFVHRLVAEAFIPNPCPEKYDIVNHKIEGDEGKLINTVENLEWCDYDYNNNYGTHNERSAKARTNHPDLSKTVYQFTKDTHELVQEWQSTKEVYRQTGWSYKRISDCCNGRQKSAYGFVWSYELLTA